MRTSSECGIRIVVAKEWRYAFGTRPSRGVPQIKYVKQLKAHIIQHHFVECDKMLW